ncbi:MAG: hypothetical protein ACYC2O_04790, partial [Microthrixaceae bacterium]
MNDAGWPPGGDPVRIRLVRVRVPLLRVHRAAHGTESVRDVVLVGWTRPDRIEGWAECSTLSDPGYVTETTDEAWRHLVTRLAPEAVEGRSRPVTGARAASAALLDAALDAELRSSGRSLVDALGGTPRPLERCVVVAAVGEDPESVGAAARSAIDAG